MNWQDIHKQKPPKFGYYHACNDITQEYYGELLWKPDYNSFFETKGRSCLTGFSMVEEQMPNVSHWMSGEDMPLPVPGVVLELECDKPLSVQLSRREIEVFDFMLAALPVYGNMNEEDIILIDKVRDKFFEVLDNE